MKRLLFAAALAAATAPVIGADVGVSVSIGQPGFYGRIDIGDYPQPRVIYQQPRIVERVPVGRPPIYLYVPPGHAKNWRKHCREYNACGERVYFVQENWYQREYLPRYQDRHGDRGAKHGDERGGDHGGDQHDHHGKDHGQGHNR